MKLKNNCQKHFLGHYNPTLPSLPPAFILLLSFMRIYICKFSFMRQLLFHSLYVFILVLSFWVFYSILFYFFILYAHNICNYSMTISSVNIAVLLLNIYLKYLGVTFVLVIIVCNNSM